MWFRAGLVAIVLSFVPWLAIALAPLLGLSIAEGAGLVGVAVVVAEVLFWAGLALAGKDTWQAVKAHGWAQAPRELVRLLVSGRPARVGVDVATEAAPKPATGLDPLVATSQARSRSLLDLPEPTEHAPTSRPPAQAPQASATRSA